MDLVLHIGVMICIYAILVTSFNLLIGFSGLFAFGHATFYALGAYTTAIVALRLHLPFPLPLLISVVLTGAVGLAVALPSLRISGIYLIITTLALQVIAIDILINWTNLTGGPSGLSGVPPLSIAGYALSGPAKFLPVAALGALGCYLIARHVGNAPFGRALRAMRENESAAASVGKNIFAMNVSVFGLAAALAAVAGSLFARYFSYVGADSFQVSETMLILSMVVVGAPATCSARCSARPCWCFCLRWVAGYGKKTVVNGVDLAVEAGEIVTVLGHNGAGKTTLLRAVFGLIRARAGRVTFDGREITGRGPSANIADGVALVPQGHGIFRTLTVQQNLELGGFSVTDRRVMAQRLERAFALFPILRERRTQIGGTMSGGQQQMLAIGMALMSGPRLLILDEPSIGLAPLLVERVMESIREINRSTATTILLVEQNLKHGLAIAQRAVVLNRGSKVFDGDPAELRDAGRLLALF